MTPSDTDGKTHSQRIMALPGITAAKKQLAKLRAMETKYFLEIAKQVVALKAEAAEAGLADGVDAWLIEEAGFTAIEAKTFASFDSALANSPVLKRKSASPHTIAALSETDELTRSECLTYMDRNERVDAGRVQQRGRKNALAAMSADELAQYRRQQLFHEAAQELSTSKLRRIERGADELLHLMDLAKIDPVRGHLPIEMERETLSALREVALEVLTDLEDLFANHSYETTYWTTNPKAVAVGSIRFAKDVLKELAEGELRPSDLSSVDATPDQRCGVEFLAGRRPYAVTSRAAAGGGRTRLFGGPTFIDMDAGIGGSTLGLTASGMTPFAIFTKSASEADAISSNLPEEEWDVRKLRKDVEDQIRSLKKQDVDVITCGLPWHHYESGDGNIAFENAFRAVDALQPKTFFFEVLSKEDDEGRIAEKLVDKGYDLGWYTLDSADFGLVQSKKRHIVVGARDGVLSRFSMPVFSARPQSLGDAIGSLMFEHAWSGTDSEEDRIKHFSKVQTWLDTHGQEAAPRFKHPFDKHRIAPLWKTLGINIDRFVVKPPTPKDMTWKRGFRLNTDMVKRIQGFPDDWKVVAGRSKALEVAGAFPPLMAKIVGLALHSALSGREFDYERALSIPLLRAVKHKEKWKIPSASQNLLEPNRVFMDLDTERRRINAQARVVHAARQEPEQMASEP